MALKFGKTHRERMMSVLMDEHESLDDAVDAVFDLMGDLVAERASFVVVGQLSSTKDRLSVPPSDPEAIKLGLGPFSTEGDARSAADSLWTSTATGDTFRTWVLPVFAGTAAEFHKDRKDKLIAAEQKRKAAASERMRKQIEKQQQVAQERSDRIRAMEEAAGQHWPCPSNRIKAGGCLHDPTCK